MGNPQGIPYSVTPPAFSSRQSDEYPRLNKSLLRELLSQMQQQQQMVARETADIGLPLSLSLRNHLPCVFLWFFRLCRIFRLERNYRPRACQNPIKRGDCGVGSDAAATGDSAAMLWRGGRRQMRMKHTTTKVSRAFDKKAYINSSNSWIFVNLCYSCRTPTRVKNILAL